MAVLISELIVSLDMCARGTHSPGYYGYSGPEFNAWLKTNNEKPHRKLVGRKTYELLNALPAEARGSLSVMRQLIEAGLLDVLRLMVCPLVLPKTGVERIFEDLQDMAFSLSSQQILDNRVLVLDYQPDGSPPRSDAALER